MQHGYTYAEDRQERGSAIDLRPRGAPLPRASPIAGLFDELDAGIFEGALHPTATLLLAKAAAGRFRNAPMAEGLMRTSAASVSCVHLSNRRAALTCSPVIVIWAS